LFEDAMAVFTTRRETFLPESQAWSVIAAAAHACWEMLKQARDLNHENRGHSANLDIKPQHMKGREGYNRFRVLGGKNGNKMFSYKEIDPRKPAKDQNIPPPLPKQAELKKKVDFDDYGKAALLAQLMFVRRHGGQEERE
jgi:hypothetical protein